MNDRLARMYMKSQRELYDVLNLLWKYAEPADDGWYVIRVDPDTAQRLLDQLGAGDRGRKYERTDYALGGETW